HDATLAVISTLSLHDALPISAAKGEPFICLDGTDRAMLYIVAAYTGLRCSELARLTPFSFEFDECTVTVHAAYSKHRRRDVLALRADLVERLRNYLANKPPDKPVWVE